MISEVLPAPATSLGDSLHVPHWLAGLTLTLDYSEVSLPSYNPCVAPPVYLKSSLS